MHTGELARAAPVILHCFMVIGLVFVGFAAVIPFLRITTICLISLALGFVTSALYKAVRLLFILPSEISELVFAFESRSSYLHASLNVAYYKSGSIKTEERRQQCDALK